jgi:hypothetical protein
MSQVDDIIKKFEATPTPPAPAPQDKQPEPTPEPKPQDKQPDPNPDDQPFIKVGDAKKAFQERDELRKRLQAYEQREREEADRKEREKQAAKEKRLVEEGKVTELLAEKEKTWSEKHRGYQSKVESKLVKAAITAAASSIPNIAPGAADDVQKLLQQHVRLNHETLEYEVVDMNSQGEWERVKDADFKDVSLDDFVKRFVASRPWYLVDRQVPSTGLTPGSRQGTPQRYTLEQAMSDPSVASKWQKDDPEGYKQATDQMFNPDAMKQMALKKVGL